MRPGWRRNRRPKCRDQGGIRGRASRPNERGRGPSGPSCRRSTHLGRVSAEDTPIADIDAPRHRRADRVSATPPHQIEGFPDKLYGRACINRKNACYLHGFISAARDHLRTVIDGDGWNESTSQAEYAGSTRFTAVRQVERTKDNRKYLLLTTFTKDGRPKP